MATDDSHVVIAVEESDSSVGMYAADDGREVGRVRVGHWPHEIAVSPDGRTAYVTNFGLKDYDERIGRPGASISIIDVPTRCERDRLYTMTDTATWFAPHGVKLSPDGALLAVNVERGDKLLLFDASARRLLHAFAVPNDPGPEGFAPPIAHDVPPGTHNFIFSADGRHIFLVAAAGGIVKLETGTGTVVATFVAPTPIRGLTFTADGRALLASGNGALYVVDPSAMTATHTVDDLGVGQILYSLPLPGGRYVLSPAVWESQVVVVDLEASRVVKRLLTGLDPIAIVLAPGGNRAYVSHGRSKWIGVIDVATLDLVGRIATRGGPNGIATAPLSERPTRKTLSLGAILPLSGPSAAEGRDLRMGYQLWQELVNDAGGLLVQGVPHDVEITYADTESAVDREAVDALARSFLDRHGVTAMLGTYPSPPNEHVGRVANEHQIPFVTASGAAGRIYDQGFDFVFGIMSSARAFLEGALRAALQCQPTPKRIAFLVCDDPAAVQDAETTAGIAVDLGLQIVTPEVTAGFGVRAPGIVVYGHLHGDFSAQLDRFRAVDPDLFVSAGHLVESVAIVNQARAIRFSPPGFAFSVGPAMPAFSDRLGDAAEHMIGAAMWSSVQQLWGRDRFVTPAEYARVFFERYSARPSHLSAGATACGVILEDAILRAGSADRIAVRDALRATDVRTFYSRVHFDAKGLNYDRPLLTIQLRRVGDSTVHVPVWPPHEATGEIVWPFPGFPDSGHQGG